MLQRALAWWNAQRIANATVILVVIYVVLWALHPSLILSGTTITGGDTGAHVATPLYLRQHLGLGALTSWYPGWFDGFPLYTYYFVLPDAIASLLSFVISYAVAFKLATILGSLLMPVGAFVMARLFRAPDPIPAALAGATLPFLFDSSFTIDGGNLFSTLAGEYSFSLSLALALITIGLFARGIRIHRGRWPAAILLSMTLAAHVLPWMFALVVIALVLLLEIFGRNGAFDRERGPTPSHHSRRAVWFVVSSGVFSAGLSAWWLLPFATTQTYTNSMGYTNDAVDTFHAVFTQLGWFNATGGAGGDQWAIVLAFAALIMAFVWRDRLGITLTLSAVLAAVAFIVDPQSAIWNERLVPFWYISVFLSAGWLVGALLLRLSRTWERIFPPGPSSGGPRIVMIDGLPAEEDASEPARRQSRRVVQSTFFMATLTMVVTIPGLVPWLGRAVGVTPGANQVANWASWNYSGYEAKAAWPEYHGLIETMKSVALRHGCGRAMWEYEPDQSRFGSTMGLMLLPYWTNNCVGSMEGLFFESSATTPYHFLNQSELSTQPSDPMVGLDYGGLNVPQGISHLQMLGTRYYMAFSKSIVATADHDPRLIKVAVTRKWANSGVTWHIYLIRGSELVTPLTTLPNIVANINAKETWLHVNQSWWLDPHQWPTLFAADGPKNWPHHNSTAHVTRVAVQPTTVRNTVMSDQSIDFDVGRLGAPVVVKISYYPRWKAIGALGPYRVSPNLMVVVPTSHHVILRYESSPAVQWGNVITNLTALALLFALWRRRPWGRPERISW